jgi:hypothetical protein
VVEALKAKGLALVGVFTKRADAPKQHNSKEKIMSFITKEELKKISRDLDVTLNLKPTCLRLLRCYEGVYKSLENLTKVAFVNEENKSILKAACEIIGMEFKDIKVQEVETQDEVVIKEKSKKKSSKK